MRIPVPLVKQYRDYDCGPTALKIVLDYYQISADIDELTRLSCTIPVEGCMHPEDLETTAKKYDPRFRLRIAPDGEDPQVATNILEEVVRGGDPVIVNWHMIYNHGVVDHFVVVCGVAKEMWTYAEPLRAKYCRDYKENLIENWFARRKNNVTSMSDFIIRPMLYLDRKA